MSELRSYPKIYALGHKLIRDIFEGPVVVQEKIDGSQFSFGVQDGVLICRSRGAEVWRGRVLGPQEGLEEVLGSDVVPMIDNTLFKGAVHTAYNLFRDGKLVEGWVYRGEVISRPRHNTLEYGRVPEGYVILFDVDTGLEERVSGPLSLLEIGNGLGLEVVPCLAEGVWENFDQFQELLERESCLGKVKIEGVVVKNYNRFNTMDGKMLMGKYVSEVFKEKHKREWSKTNPGTGDKVQQIIASLRTTARWEKAVQRRRDAGLLQEQPEDIGPMIADLLRDTAEEEGEWIKDKLYAAFEKQILRGVTAGFPEWYKSSLLESAFEPSNA